MILGSIVVAVLFFLGIIFAFASAYNASRLIVSGIFFVVGLFILRFVNDDESPSPIASS